MNIPEFELEGTTEDIAEQVFQKLIYPIYDELKKTDPVLAKRFGYCVAGNAIASYLGGHTDVKRAENVMIDLTKKMANGIAQEKIKHC
ncbi:hypothetical protein [Acinetobacter sp.]|uniref:hypothetical protein n=1 Tax=Acinetobacter sp. TaxID=472 RepID=UPI002590C291|nr:hypothetical protein [Acinetobacter sp.]